MKKLAAQWKQGSARFAALSQRERAIVSAAIVLGGGFLILNFALEPAQLKLRRATTAIAAADQGIAQQQAMLTALTVDKADPDAPNRQRLDAARKNLAIAGARLVRFEAGMVPPARMQAFLDGVLSRHRGLELLSLKTLAVTPIGQSLISEKLSEKKAASALAAATEIVKDPSALVRDPPKAVAHEGIYQHGMEISLAGNYNDLLNYLEELERLPQKVMWNSVELKTDKYPRNILTLRLYTLSLDSAWLAV